MTADLWTRLADLLPEALDVPHDERGAFLDAACRAADGTPDAALRREVAALLRASDAADASGRLRSPLDGVASGIADAERIADRTLPERIGAWAIEGLLGEGGQGIVYRARRADGAFDRAVALKRLRPELGAALAERFDAERRLLAPLEHDGIARLYDGGVDAEGVPFLVLELVDGEPITVYADDADLDVEARVRLVVQVCDAVAYAHQRLVVHRDLKPSNVLVTADGRAKLLDFGVAKLLDPDSANVDRTLTRAALTPAYAAPEQILGGTVTTATDVYALGVLLYELLAGRRPYDLATLTAGEAERVVCETIPPPPSAQAPPERARALCGDLDVMVGKALAKEPERRYPSAEALGADLRRWLDGAPVEARATTAAYRARRFVRRHRLGVAAAAAVVLALVGGAGIALWQARVARIEADKAVAVQDFVLDMLAAADPDADGRDVRVASLLDRAAAGLDSTLADQPDVRADARGRLGYTFYRLGLLPEAEAELRRALALHTTLYGTDDPRTAQVQSSLATVLRDGSRFEAADSLYALALATLRRRAGERDERTAETLAEIGTLRFQTGDWAAAATAYREVLAIEQEVLPPGHPEIASSTANLGVALTRLSDLNEAIALLDQAVQMHRDAGLGGDRVANALANLGAAYAGAERFGDAVRVQRESVELFRRALGDIHPSTAFGLGNLGASLVSLGRPREAEPILRESAATYRTALGTDDPTVGYPLVNLAKSLRDQGRQAEARATLDAAAALFQAGFGPDHWTAERVAEVRTSLDDAP